MTEYVIVPHGERDSISVIWKKNKRVKIQYDKRSKGYKSHNEDPFIRYKNAWFYSFCHANVSLSKEIVDRIKNGCKDITFVFMNPTIEEDIWVIDTVIQLKDIIELKKDENKDKGAPYKSLKMSKVVNSIYENKNVKASLADVKNIIAKYHLPKFEGDDLENDRYQGNAYWSNEHSKPATRIMILGVADMEESYFPVEEVKNGSKYDYVPIKIESHGLSKMIKRNNDKRYNVIKLLDDRTLPDTKNYQKDLEELCQKLDCYLDKAIKVKAKDIKSDAQGMIIPNKKKS